MTMTAISRCRRCPSILQLRVLSPMIPSRLLLFMTVAISSSCSHSYPAAPLFAQHFKIKMSPHSSSLRSLLGFIPQRGHVHLPSKKYDQSDAPVERIRCSSQSENSVTGPIYELDGVPTVKLFTKQGCTLCDKVKDALESVREVQPHSLIQVDITDDDKQDWFAKYKYDIPVLHINDLYWTKHRLSIEDATAGIAEARTGEFSVRRGEPDASRLEHK